MKKVNIWQLVLMLMPLIATAQEAFSGQPGSGAKKKEFVMGMLKTILGLLPDGANIDAAEREAIEMAVSSLVDTIVKAVKVAELEAEES